MKLNPHRAFTPSARTSQPEPSSTKRAPEFFISLVAAILLSALMLAPHARAQSDKKDEKKDEKKNKEVLKIQKLTQGMGLYALGPVSPDRQSLLLLAQKPDQAPNLYLMNLADHSIRPLTSFKWGASDPAWSFDGNLIAMAGLEDNGSFSEIFILDMKTGRLRQMTKNAFSDKEPVFTPDGKRVIYTTDESPLPDAAFGVLHIASLPVGGGKPEYFTEDEVSSIHPGISAEAKSVMLVKVDETSGRHSLWRYGFDGKPQRDLTGDKFARIHRYILNPGRGAVVVWAQEAAEQQEDLYILDGDKVRDLPDPDQPKLNPALSPGGQYIAFIGPTDTGSQLFVFDFSSWQIRQLTYKPATTRTPVFVSDHEIMFGSDRDKQNEIYLIDLVPPAEKKK